jgi:hypothetical protein
MQLGDAANLQVRRLVYGYLSRTLVLEIQRGDTQSGSTHPAPLGQHTNTQTREGSGMSVHPSINNGVPFRLASSGEARAVRPITSSSGTRRSSRRCACCVRFPRHRGPCAMLAPP